MATNSAEAVPETLKYQTWILKVPIHCGGCERKVKRVLQSIDGVFTTNIDSRLHKVVVTGDVDSETLIKKLVKSGKQAELWSEKKHGKLKKKDGDNSKDSKDDSQDHEAATDKAEKSEKPVENRDANDTKDSDNEGENTSSETDEKANMVTTVINNGGGGGGGKKKKKKKKKKGQNANPEGCKDAPTGSQPHNAGPDPLSLAPASLNTNRPDHNMDAFPQPFPHYAPAMYGASYRTTNPSNGFSYYYASPMHYSYLHSHHMGPYQPHYPIKSYHYGHDEPYYDEDDEGGCSIT
ncbi:heavy metal-associated isoprenylated plant protein 36-like [Punica granatum]|uniref:Heavy metal-associated isoprenylated plant protein 36-like n=1 Tax=Punica granatum TaxID=22663 RepID=A0A218VT62_PUNGR|nr:heavy metal-associated isoprenylated plant protein 36-like [Punica granatum]OWM63513.1 hypothetical protein CDL15_Pgr019462 [Punica granatum]